MTTGPDNGAESISPFPVSEQYPFFMELTRLGGILLPDISIRQSLIQCRLEGGKASIYKPQVLAQFAHIFESLEAAGFLENQWMETMSSATDVPVETLNDFWQGLRAEFISASGQLASATFIKGLGDISELGINQMAVHNGAKSDVRSVIALAQSTGNPGDYYKGMYHTELPQVPLLPKHFAPILKIEILAFMMNEQENATGAMGNFEERVLSIARLHPTQQNQEITRLSRKLGININGPQLRNIQNMYLVPQIAVSY